MPRGPATLVLLLLAPAEATVALIDATFEDQIFGTYSEAKVAEDFGNKVTWNNGLDEGRVTIVEEDSESFMRVSYPTGGVGTALGGAQFKVPLPGSYKELFVSYRIRFAAGFDFVKGGKLPGLCGGDCRRSNTLCRT